MFQLLVVAACLAIGAAIGRWWAALFAVPVGLWATYEIPFDNSSPPYWDVGLLYAAIVGALLIAGVWLRRTLSPRSRAEPD